MTKQGQNSPFFFFLLLSFLECFSKHLSYCKVGRSSKFRKTSNGWPIVVVGLCVRVRLCGVCPTHPHEQRTGYQTFVHLNLVLAAHLPPTLPTYTGAPPKLPSDPHHTTRCNDDDDTDRRRGIRKPAMPSALPHSSETVFGRGEIRQRVLVVGARGTSS